MTTKHITPFILGAVVQSLAASNPPTTTTTARVGTAPPSQADVHDPQAVQKLKILESLNAH